MRAARIISAAVALVMVALLAPGALSEVLQPPVTETTWVMPPGQEAVLRKALLPPGARPWLVLQTALVERDRVLVRFGEAREGGPVLAVTLVHPSRASAEATRLVHFAIERTPGPAPKRELATLVKRLEAAGDALKVWKRIDPEPEEPAYDPEPPTPTAQVLEAQAAKVRATLVEVRALLARGNDAEVLAALKTLDPTQIVDGGVRLEIALTYARVGDEPAMRAVSRTFSEDPSRGEEALFGPALRGELPAPEALFEGRDDAGICTLHRIADVLGQAGRNAQAGALLGAILARVPTCARAAETWALLLIRDHRGDKAVAVLRPHHEANPTDVRIIQSLSHAYRMTGDLVEAIRLFHLTADTMAEDTQNQYLGQLLALYLVSDTVEQWVGHWREVLEKDPDHVTGRFLLGACLHYLDAFEESNVHLEKLIGVIDHEPRLYVYRAMNAFNLGDIQGARKLLEAGIALDIVDPDVFYCRAEITRDTERDLALSDLERYLTLTARSQFENPRKRARVVSMRDALVECKAQGTAVCEGPWEHPRSSVQGFFKRNERRLFDLLGVVLLVGLLVIWRRRRGRASA